eukprot:CAMPEP_0172637148 /NCGR_PEP_ID=MMETSP1068-20121228/207470_1 /TAXON_ID=35684 /ORGANISM="Pseudopedinella elastica, Strain CCMP716" /LENGTH=172 /DNA_ID=CAMNT_0013449725 /DNA_START=91 /DNA_END=607 /DNA_ORIENTATION=+
MRRNLEDLLTSSLAGVLNVLATNPLWLAATRLKRGQQKAAAPKGPASKFAPSCHGGANPSGCEGCRCDPEACEAPTRGSVSEGAPEGGLGGASEGGLVGMASELRRVAREDGPLGLWRGTNASLVLVANPAILFAAYEGLKRVILLRRKKSQKLPFVDLTAGEGFVLGAVSK